MNSYHAVIMLSGWNDQVRGIRELSAEPKAKADNTYLDIDLLRISYLVIITVLLYTVTWNLKY